MAKEGHRKQAQTQQRPNSALTVDFDIAVSAEDIWSSSGLICKTSTIQIVKTSDMEASEED
jgi:hypothetical protein